MRCDLLEGKTNLCLGLSGGADSVALLLRCHEAGYRVTALHFNHGFADEDGDGDECYVRDLCEQYHIPLIVGRCDEPFTRRETKEVFARRHRFAFFRQQLRALDARTLLLAHHADDRAENLILRLARGCGLDGLTSFTWTGSFPGASDITIVRPLLDETHAEQVRWLEEHNVLWREDLSNTDTTIARNAIRHLLTPRLKHLTMGANATADILEAEHNYLHRQMLQSIVACTKRGLYLKKGTDPILVARALRYWLPDLLTRRQTHLLCQLPIAETLEVTARHRIQRLAETQWLHLYPKSVEALAPQMVTAVGVYTFGGWQIEVAPIPEHVVPSGACFLLPLPLLVRSRRPGDKLKPIHFHGTKKVQDIFTQLKIPVAERDGIPLFFSMDGELLAIPGYRPAPLTGAPSVMVIVRKEYLG